MKIKNMMMALSLISSVSSFAGVDVGNGGTVLSCGDRIVLADFEEVSIRPGLRGKISIPEKESPTDVQVENALSLLSSINRYAGKEVREALLEFERIVKPVGDEYEWTVTPDIGPFPLPKNCELRNTVMYFDEGAVEMKTSLYDRLSPTHQAGLKLHEAVYKVARGGIDLKSTVPVRRIVAMIFSERPDMEILRSLVSTYLLPGQVKKIEVDQGTLNDPRTYMKIKRREELLNDMTYVFNSPMNEVEIDENQIGKENKYVWMKGAEVGDSFKFLVMRRWEISHRSTNGMTKITYCLMRNNDPKKGKSRNRYQEEIKCEVESFPIERGFEFGNPFYDTSFRIAFVSSRMQSFLAGSL